MGTADLMDVTQSLSLCIRLTDTLVLARITLQRDLLFYSFSCGSSQIILGILDPLLKGLRKDEDVIFIDDD